MVFFKNLQMSSLHALLEALPAASVDTGIILEADNSSSSSNSGNFRSHRQLSSSSCRSSESLDSRCSDLDSYFYI